MHHGSAKDDMKVQASATGSSRQASQGFSRRLSLTELSTIAEAEQGGSSAASRPGWQSRKLSWADLQHLAESASEGARKAQEGP